MIIMNIKTLNYKLLLNNYIYKGNLTVKGLAIDLEHLSVLKIKKSLQKHRMQISHNKGNSIIENSLRK